MARKVTHKRKKTTSHSKKKISKKISKSLNKNFLIIIIFLILIITATTIILNQKKFDDANTYVYFTGSQCPSCEITDDQIEISLKKENIFLVVYDVYASRNNGHALIDFSKKKGITPALPNLVLEKNNFIAGENISFPENKIILTNDGSYTLEEIDFIEIKGTPTLMYEQKSVILKNKSSNSMFIKDFFRGLKTKDLKKLNPEKNVELKISKINQKFNFKVEFKGNIYYFD